jgi:hypothetical protein
MKIFISWSGDVSHRAALKLRDWLPDVVQSAEPFVSSEDIKEGTRWANELAGTLEQYSLGILCITPQNLDSRWLNFEAGALAKSIKQAEEPRVMALLLGLGVLNLEGPLTQFQLTPYEESRVLKLVTNINELVPPPRADANRIRRAFNHNWPLLKESLDALVEETKADGGEQDRQAIDVPAVLEEILTTVRSQQNLLASRYPPTDPSLARVSRDEIKKLSDTWALIGHRLIDQEDPAAVPADLWEFDRMVKTLAKQVAQQPRLVSSRIVSTEVVSVRRLDDEQESGGLQPK